MSCYNCIISSIEPENNGKRFTMLVVRTSRPITHPHQIEWSPPIFGTVTAFVKSVTDPDGEYGKAFSKAMCQQIEQAVRRGSFPDLDLVIPEALIRQNMFISSDPIIHCHLGMIMYSFSV